MQAVGEFGVKQLVYKTVSNDPTVSFKSGRDDAHAKMGAPAFARSGMARMPVRLVDDLDETGVKRLCQTRDTSLLHDQPSLSR
jgi:hypothetical protein